MTIKIKTLKTKTLNPSNLNIYDIDTDKHADKKDSGKDKCVSSIDILPATEMSDNAYEDLNISSEEVMMNMMTIPSTSLLLSILTGTK